MLNRVNLGKALFATLFVLFFVGMLWFVTGGRWDVVLFSAPILLVAEAIWFGNQYLNIFEDGHEEEEAHEHEAEAHPIRQRIAH